MSWAAISGYLEVLGTHWADVLGYIAAILTISAFSSATMIPLRIFGISTNCFNIAYGIFAHAYPPLVLHIILLPLNAVRLYQMLQLVEKVKIASHGDLNVDWLKRFMSKRATKAGEVIFHAGDISSAMYYTVSGRYRLVEIQSEIGPGEVIGEVGLISPNNKRTLTFQCVEAGEMLAIGYTEVKQLYFQNPKFGFYFLELIAQRLFRDIRRLEARLAASPA
ncbi:MAG TPA: Crp/Fnr family transcriptional regulator [Xanthobacteraceae bacterium]|nr:Crp/Fnr family transcriptional regulator [Xanthobacteraceae bacterium]